MAYFPPQGSIVTYQVIPSSNLGGASIFGSLPAGTQVLGSVTTLQGTNPWNIAGSVLSFPGANQSVSGTVGTSVIGNVPVTVTNNHSVTLLSGGNVVGSIATLQGTNPWITRGSVSGTVDIGTIPGSVVAYQGTNPWIVGSIITTIPGTPFRYQGSLVSASVTLIAGSVASRRHYITDFRFANTGSVSTLITFRDGSASILGYTIAPATGGSNNAGSLVPDQTNPSQDLAFGMGIQVSVLYATVNGYTL